MRNSPNALPLFVIALWATLNLVQAWATGLYHDEALYWLCSQHLNWGFWDHPPAAPTLIFLGYSILPSEMGVRLFIVLASAATIYGIWKLVQPEDTRLFFALVFSIFLVHIGGFMAAPDIPLLLFATWFLVLYRKYLSQDSWPLAIVLGLVVAGMAYSKYHGAIFLAFALLGHPAILLRRSFWIIPLVALVVFSPHLWWQWSNGFPTFRYHLIDRAGDPYRWTFILDHLGGQLLVLGPFVSILLLIAAFRFRSSGPFEKVLTWSFWGVMAFFLYQSFTQRTEANWTATAIIPLIYLSYRFIAPRRVWRKWLFGLAIPSFLLIGAFRLDLMTGCLPDALQIRRETDGWDLWARDVEALADGRPVVFLNTYRMPSRYRFYTHQTAYSLNVEEHAGNQYDLFPEEEAALQGREVLVISGDLNEGIRVNMGGMKEMKYRFEEDFRSFNRVRIRVLNAPEKLPADTLVYLQIGVKNPTGYPVSWNAGSRNVELEYRVYAGDEPACSGIALADLPEGALGPGEEQIWEVAFRTPSDPGEYRFRYQFRVEGLFCGRSGNFSSLEVY